MSHPEKPMSQGNGFTSIIFDFDGTLVDTLKDIADAMNSALATLGFKTYPVDDYRHFIGYGVDRLARRVVPEEYHTEKTLNECLEIMAEEYRTRWHKNSRPFPGITELLKKLKGMGVKTAVLSNKDHIFTRQMAAALLSPHVFDCVQGALPSMPKKPDPALALRVAQTLGEEPSRIVLAGDTRTDMETACAAGMHPVGCLWGYRDEEELRKFGARGIVSAPGELARLFIP